MTTLPFRTAADVSAALDKVRAHLDAGGIIAYPTETVYGFGCALVPAALARLAAMKGREAERPFLLLHSAPRRLAGLRWNDAARALAGQFWPGPLTIALAADPAVYAKPVLSNENTVAVRQTSHGEVRALISGLRGPITSTSANSPGARPATTAEEVVAALEAITASGAAHPVVDLPILDVLILDGGAIPATAPSTIVDCSGPVPRIVREGAVAAADLRAILTQAGFAIDV